MAAGLGKLVGEDLNLALHRLDELLHSRGGPLLEDPLYPSSSVGLWHQPPVFILRSGIKVQTRVGQNSLMFELLPVHGSFSMPTTTLNILPYSNTSSIHTHLTTFNPTPFMTTIISSYFLFFKLLLSYVLLLYILHIFKHAK